MTKRVFTTENTEVTEMRSGGVPKKPHSMFFSVCSVRSVVKSYVWCNYFLRPYKEKG